MAGLQYSNQPPLPSTYAVVLTTEYSNLRTTEDPPPTPSQPDRDPGQVQCEIALPDGTPCDFVGTPAQVGVHKYYHHGLCNPIKATVVSRECPGCGTLFADKKSAKEHAHRSWKDGFCTTKKVSRPYAWTLQPDLPPTPYDCQICHETLYTDADIRAHMREHFLALVPAQRAPTDTPTHEQDPPPDPATESPDTSGPPQQHSTASYGGSSGSGETNSGSRPRQRSRSRGRADPQQTRGDTGPARGEDLNPDPQHTQRRPASRPHTAAGPSKKPRTKKKTDTIDPTTQRTLTSMGIVPKKRPFEEGL